MRRALACAAGQTQIGAISSVGARTCASAQDRRFAQVLVSGPRSQA